MTTATFTILVRHGNSQRWTDNLGQGYNKNRWSNKAICYVVIAELEQIWPDARMVVVPTADLDLCDLD